MTTPWLRIAWWWNGSWGAMTRRDVWLEQHRETAQFRVRWRLGDDEDEQLCANAELAIYTLKLLLGEDKSVWHEKVYLDENGDLWDYNRPLEKVLWRQDEEGDA